MLQIPATVQSHDRMTGAAGRRVAMGTGTEVAMQSAGTPLVKGDLRRSPIAAEESAVELNRRSTVGIYPMASCRESWHVSPMHHLRSRSAVVPFRLAAFLLVVVGLLAAVAVALLLQSILTDDTHTGAIGAGLMSLSLALAIPQWVTGAHTACPLCWAPVLGQKSCSKHRKARRFMGSHRLRVALAVLFKNQFRCPFCNESTELTESPPYRAADHWAQLD